MQNIQNGRIDVTEFDLAYIKVDDEALLNKYFLRPGDLLFNVRNSFDLVGKMAIYDGVPERTIYNHMLLRIRLKNFALPAYVNYLFQTQEISSKINQIKKGSTSIWAIYQKDLNSLTIQLPTIETQSKIIEGLNSQMVVIEGLGKMKAEAGKNVTQILADVWDVEYVDQLKMEVENEQEN